MDSNIGRTFPPKDKFIVPNQSDAYASLETKRLRKPDAARLCECEPIAPDSLEWWDCEARLETDVLLSACTTRLELLTMPSQSRGELGGLVQATRIGNALPSDIKRCAMVNAGANDWQP